MKWIGNIILLLAAALLAFVAVSHGTYVYHVNTGVSSDQENIGTLVGLLREERNDRNAAFAQARYFHAQVQELNAIIQQLLQSKAQQVDEDDPAVVSPSVKVSEASYKPKKPWERRWDYHPRPYDPYGPYRTPPYYNPYYNPPYYRPHCPHCPRA